MNTKTLCCNLDAGYFCTTRLQGDRPTFMNDTSQKPKQERFHQANFKVFLHGLRTPICGYRS